jgi:hypothetical protein
MFIDSCKCPRPVAKKKRKKNVVSHLNHSANERSGSLASDQLVHDSDDSRHFLRAALAG